MSFRRIAAAAGLALTVALSVAMPASAAPVSGVAPASAAVSPVCSGTEGWGKIAYQVASGTTATTTAAWTAATSAW